MLLLQADLKSLAGWQPGTRELAGHKVQGSVEGGLASAWMSCLITLLVLCLDSESPQNIGFCLLELLPDCNGEVSQVLQEKGGDQLEEA